MRGEDAVSTLEWATTAPIVLGVGLSSYAQDAFHVLGFVMALLSNFMFSLRALHSKQVCQRNHCFPSITQFPVAGPVSPDCSLL